jgi:EpsI family protein
VAEQYFAVASLICALCTVLGSTVSRRLAFPLGYMLLAVPVGEALIPYLIDYTAAVTVTALRITGVPVLQEGNILTLPNATWSVVEACSGLRFLVACVTIGLPYAYLSYRSWKKRFAFVGASIAVPIVANWLRAYMVIMIGYMSDMRLAVGIDHAMYGWVLYAFVMFFLLWVGSRFRDPHSVCIVELGDAPAAARTSLAHNLLVGIGVVACASLFPIWASHVGLARELPLGRLEPIELPASLGRWGAVDQGPAARWEPRYVGADIVAARSYESAGETVRFHVALYSHEGPDAELVGHQNQLIQTDDPVWRQLAHGARATAHGEVDERLISSASGAILVWRWYWVAGHRTESPVWAKVIEGVRKLFGLPTPAAGIVVFTESARDVEGARRRLEDFAASALPELETRLGKAVE